jgi:crotonobetainyl-CoA:carnitine CoA-transferase CaiB-like acyl-CoA transferase
MKAATVNPANIFRIGNSFEDRLNGHPLYITNWPYTSTSMHHVVIVRHGPPEVLEAHEAPDPAPGDGEVRIAVRAAGVNFADTGAPFYEVYECADGRHIAVGALERPFYLELLEGLGLDEADLPDRRDETSWPALKDRFAAVFRTRSPDAWVAQFERTDACVAPVLSPAEVAGHPHNAARGVFADIGGVSQPAPAPRFGRTAAAQPAPPVRPGADTDAVLSELGIDQAQIADLRASGVVA